MSAYTTTTRLYLTEDDRVVEYGDPAARWLFAAAGAEVAEADAIKYGLKKGQKPAEVSTPPSPIAEPVVPTESVRSKAASIPANKAKQATKKKG